MHRKSTNWILTALIVAVGLAGLPSRVMATTIILSNVSSDATPVSQLAATLDFVVDDFDLGNPGDELMLTVTNQTTSPNEFNINEVFWNGSDDVYGLTLLTVTHSVAGDVSVGWDSVINKKANGFGTFDFGLTDGVGEMNPNVIGPGELIVFILGITSSSIVNMDDFDIPNARGFTAAAKFVNGPDDPESPGNEDSAFGAGPVQINNFGPRRRGPRRRTD